jgi:cellobiose phosphorylase
VIKAYKKEFVVIAHSIKKTIKDVRAGIERVIPPKEMPDEKPIRAELFSIDQFKAHAKKLAGKHNVSFKTGHEKLLDRLKDNKAILLRAYELLNDAGKAKRSISPAGEWLLDNYYLIEEQIRLTQKHLPKVYSRELPSLSKGPMEGFPRIYDIAMEIVSHGDGRLDVKGLEEFVASYQSVKNLKLGELWGIPIMIRLALIENLRRVSTYMMATQMQRDRADFWANRILETSGGDSNDIVKVVASMAKEDPPMSDSFVSEFVRRLHGMGASLNLPLIWLEKKLSENGETIERLIQATGQKQAANQVSIANTIESLRLIERTDWHDFVEELSVVERELKLDPSGDYPGMSFDTRDRYRHVIEDISMRCRIDEVEVAARVVQLAALGKKTAGAGAAAAHVGYYLIDRGLVKLYKSFGRRLPAGMLRQANITTPAMIIYFSGIILATAALGAPLFLMLLHYGPGMAAWDIIFAPFILLAAGQTAISLVNFFSTFAVKPVVLPRMDFTAGIPRSAHTLVVFPSLLSGKTGVSAMLENIEVCFLANRDGNIDFAMITDFTDAPEETMAGDGVLLEQASAGITRLNGKYGAGNGDIFFLLHRARKWNTGEMSWMGYERKRGKIADLNALLRGSGKEAFVRITGDISRLQDVKNVITLDADTVMPRNAARELAAVISHPLNRPVFDEKKKRVVSGYGILQPRVEAGYPGETPSAFVKLFGGETGIDPYTRAVSDVYQDLFNEGSYIGKGLYSVDAFELCLKGRMPENLILSHDMLEGCYARSGLVTDVQLYEKFPSAYLKEVSRRRRWIRGDWQVSAWMFPKVPGPGNKKNANPVSILSRWKILDNLRRSLVPVSVVFLIVSGWLVLKNTAAWTAAVIILAGLPIPFITMASMLRKPAGVGGMAHLTSVFYALVKNAAQFFISLSFIIYEAYFSTGAAATTFWRKHITRHRLLQWTTSWESELRAKKNPVQFYQRMYIGPLIVAAVIAAGRAAYDPFSLLLMAMWIFSPVAAYFISLLSVSKRTVLSGQEAAFLRRQARRTWNFFETFVTAHDNWLPPDNFQEDPASGAAHRTSPTNMGLSLLSSLAAFDFGYISAGLLLNRSQKSINVMNTMARYKGHFFNWYDTKTLKPLEPQYVSSVDSGNLCGHLLVLRSGLFELKETKIVSSRIFDGLSDTLEILDESLMSEQHGNAENPGPDARKPAEWISRFREKLAAAPDCLSESHTLLRQLSTDISKMIPAQGHSGFVKTKKWAHAFEKQCYDHLEDMSFIAPWILLPPDIPGMWEHGGAEQKERLSGLREEFGKLDSIPTLSGAARLEQKFVPVIDQIIGNISPAEDENGRYRDWFEALKKAVREASTRASERMNAVDYAALLCGEMSDVEYDFIFNRETHFLSIGYNTGAHRADPSYYDLLASESRLSTFVAIAQGRMPQESWFMLGRLISKHGGDPVLVSWGGSMFEYLMPLLVMPNYDGTLLDRTYKSVLTRQMEYASRNNVPWGISESGYNKLDQSMSYQYRSFGVPDTGFKRGLAEDLVIAPYAGALALMVDPGKACGNLQHMHSMGLSGEFGFYEAVDYTPSRLAPDQTRAVIKSYMAHHQGMTLLSYAYALLDRPMQRRFLSDPGFKATEMLLQERVADDVPYLYDTEVTGPFRNAEEREALLRVYTNPDTPMPETHLLSNGNYSVMVTSSGGGYSRWKNIAVTRWREDAQLDNEGTFIYLRDTRSGEFWSSAFQPALKRPKHYEAVFSRSRAEFKRRDNLIDTHTEIAVSPEDDIELRRVSITNRSRERRSIEVTSFAGAVLNYQAADLSHTSFSNLFVQTEIIRQYQAVLCSRRPRSESEKFPVMMHLMAVHGTTKIPASYETDRSRFLGRYNTAANPDAMQKHGPLSGSEGDVLDPSVSIRCTVELDPDETAVVDYVTGICADRGEALKLMEKYRDRNLADRVFNLAWIHGQVALQQINATEADAQLYGRLASAVIFSNPAWRANASILRRNFRGQSDLWGYGISGDLPIVLVRIEDRENLELITSMVHAHSYWRMNGLAADLVIWNEDFSVYRDAMSEKINRLIAENVSGSAPNTSGGIFLRRSDQMSEEDKILMQTVARIIITDRGGTLSEQLERISHQGILRPRLAASRRPAQEKPGEETPRRADLAYFNGFGGFTGDGREYVITTDGGMRTPAPWSNVLANKNFGAVITESGGSYTWSENAHEFRLTPWKNDPVTDASGEAMYIRDEETGKFWSPSPLPAEGETRYVSRHGFGYSVFEHVEQGLVSELTVFVPLEHPVKFSILKLRNISGRARKVSVSNYNELVMGTHRDKYQMHIVTEIDPKSGALLAYNHYNKDFPGRVVFLDVSEPARYVSGDRAEFIGRNGTMASPTAMSRDRLSGKTGAGFDPCAAVQIFLDIGDGEEKEVVFTFGSGSGADDARGILRRFNGVESVRHELENVWEYWKRTLGVIYVETPDQSLNFLVNGWLQYQTISCRLLGRSGYYQSGGAYGFRDQLQDVMSLTHSDPPMIREKLLFFASRQFVEGDVQHWWHPPSGRGIRSRCSDDYLWLPFAACAYVDETGDTGIMDEKVNYLEGPRVKTGEESYYGEPSVSASSGTLYEHCAAAVEHGLNFGAHGLPLIGSGDWNDGMNLVGPEGKGESVWLAFFLAMTLKSMAGIASARGDNAASEKFTGEAEKLAANIDEGAWDGGWYLRAYFDSGEKMGSAQSVECVIDSLPQSWAVISGLTDPARAKAAMENVDARLVDRKNALIKIFEPPFDKTGPNPGYIRGYLPGVRENGGQYTHAAVWTVMAFAMLKDKKRAWELLGLINPVGHGATNAKSAVYKVEPYVLAADVYSEKNNAGRGGWTWYTGSASWMYQLVVKYMLGLRISAGRLYFDPCLPDDWPSFKLHYRYRETFYHITIERSGAGDGVLSVAIDGAVMPEKHIELHDDRVDHNVRVEIG